MSVGDIMAKGNNYKKNKKKSSNGVKNKVDKELKSIDGIKKVDKEAKSNDETKTVNNGSDKVKTVNKVKRDLIYSGNDSADEMSKLLKIVLIVTGVMILFYGITVLITKKSTAIKTAKLGKSSEKVTIQYDEIIIGSMLNMDGHYYILIEKEDDENSSEYDTLLKSIEANDEALKVYKADLNSSFNKDYIGKDSNYDSDLTKFKVKDTTLLEINEHKIENTFDNYDSIKGKLDELK